MVFILLFLLTGCALTKKFDGTATSGFPGIKTEVSGPMAQIPLAPPLGPARRIVQQLTAQWPGREESLLCILELDNQRIAMAGLTTDGLSLFNLSYDGQRLQSDKTPLMPVSVAPERIIADLQLVYWPLASLTKILPRHWRLETANSHRRLYFNDGLRVEVRYRSTDVMWPKIVELINHEYNYRLYIETISYETLSE